MAQAEHDPGEEERDLECELDSMGLLGAHPPQAPPLAPAVADVCAPRPASALASAPAVPPALAPPTAAAAAAAAAAEVLALGPTLAPAPVASDAVRKHTPIRPNAQPCTKKGTRSHPTPPPFLNVDAHTPEHHDDTTWRQL